MKWLLTLLWGDTSARRNSAEESYAEAIISKLDRDAVVAPSPRGGADPARPTYRELRLVDAFVDLDVREISLANQPADLTRRLADTGFIGLDELRGGCTASSLFKVVCNELCRVVILGNPGTGKSSLLREQALLWAHAKKGALSSETHALPGPLPILVDLKAYAAMCSANGLLPLVDYLCEGGGLWTEARDVFDTAFAAPPRPVSVMLDGLDEVTTKRARLLVMLKIAEFAASAEGKLAHIFVTSRVCGYDDAHFRGIFAHYMLQPLTETQSCLLLTNWYRGVCMPGEDALVAAKVTSLTELVNKNDSMKQFTETPFMLTMLAAVHLGTPVSSETSRTELFQLSSAQLQLRWSLQEELSNLCSRSGCTLRPFDGDGIKLELLRELVAQIILASNAQRYQHLGNIFDVSLLRDVFAGLSQYTPGLDSVCVADALISQIKKQHGILRFLGGDSFSFACRPLLDYHIYLWFADQWHARRLQPEDLVNFFVACGEYQSWHEVLSLCSGLLPAKEAILCLQAFERVGASPWAVLNCLEQIPQESRGEVSHSLPHIRVWLEKLCCPSPASSADEIAFSAVAIGTLTRVFAKIERERTRGVLESAARVATSQRAPTAVTALAHVFPDERTFSVLLGLAQSPHDTAEAALTCLSESITWSRLPETAAVMLRVAMPSHCCAHVSISYFLKRFPKDPRTAASAISIALAGGAGALEAVMGLVGAVEENSAARAVLLLVIQCWSDQAVGSEAIAQLVTHFHDVDTKLFLEGLVALGVDKWAGASAAAQALLQWSDLSHEAGPGAAVAPGNSSLVVCGRGDVRIA